MTSNSTNKSEKNVFVLEWESAELKDGATRYENFKIIAGNDKQNLLFYSTFFSDDFKFKKGEFYQFSTSGKFLEDNLGNAVGNFDATGIIREIDNGSYEFEKIIPSLFIKGLLEKNERIGSLEKSLKEKKEFVDRVNREAFESRKELSDLQSEFGKLRLEKEEVVKEVGSLKEELEKKKKDIEEKEKRTNDLQQEIQQLKGRLNDIKFEKNKIENSWVNPERYSEEKQKKEDIRKELDEERKRKQKIAEQLEELINREWRVVIETKLQEKKSNLDYLRVVANNKLENNEKIFLEMLLTTQEQFDSLVFEGVSQTICSPMEKQLKNSKDKLTKTKKITLEEINSLCRAQTEVTKLQNQLNQWDKIEKIEECIEVPPK